VWIKLQDRILTAFEIIADQVELKISLQIKSKPKKARCCIVIQAIDLESNHCILECPTHTFIVCSHPRYLNEENKNQRLVLQHHTHDDNNLMREIESHPQTGVSELCSQQVAERNLMARYVRVPTLSFGGRLKNFSKVKLQYWFVILQPGQDCISLAPSEGHICCIEELFMLDEGIATAMEMDQDCNSMETCDNAMEIEDNNNIEPQIAAQPQDIIQQQNPGTEECREYEEVNFLPQEGFCDSDIQELLDHPENCIPHFQL